MEFDKRGLSNEDLKKRDEKEGQMFFQFRATKTIRVISGGHQKDFEDFQKAINHLINKIKYYGYGNINLRCPILFKECLPTTSLVQQ